MRRGCLLRNGEITYNADIDRNCGLTDALWTAKGLQQAREVAKLLENVQFDGIYSSPLSRAFETAKIAAGNKQVEKVDRLIEADFGKWEGKTRQEFIAEDPELWARWSQHPESTKAGETGETALEVAERVEGLLEEIGRASCRGR